jgi:formylmethanofuran dehydrogenase subunit E
VKRITLKEAIKFHGHLGPYLILGILAGNLALKELRCKKHFGINIKVWGANKKPESCLIDGLQLSTGATYGKGNIKKLTGPKLRIEFYHTDSKKKVALKFRHSLLRKLNQIKTHRESEKLAKQLYKISSSSLFNYEPNRSQ